MPQGARYQPQDDMSDEKLVSGEAVYVMQYGGVVEGAVTDTEGEPVAGATVRIGGDDMINYWGNKASITDEQGKYRITWKKGTFPIMVNAPGKAPELVLTKVGENNPPVDFTLQSGKMIRVKVVDRADNPISGVYVGPYHWRGTSGYFHDKLKDNKRTDENGLWTWNEAPTDAVGISAGQRGFQSEKESYTLEPRDEPYTIVMIPNVHVTGRIVDAATKEPIPAVVISPGYKWSPQYREPLLQSHDPKGFSDGHFDFEIERHNFGYNLRIEAEGYASVTSKTWTVEQGDQVWDVEMSLTEPISGVVLLPDGRPAENATVKLCTTKHGALTIWNGDLGDRFDGTAFDTSRAEGATQKTKADGSFSFTNPGDQYMFAIAHEEGALLAEPEDFVDGKVTLRPWSRVEGVVMKGSQPWPEQSVNLANWSDCSICDIESCVQVQFLYSGKSDAEGRFVFEKVIPGREFDAFWEEYFGQSATDHFLTSIRSGNVKFESQSGQTHKIQIGGTGRPVVGRIVDTGKYREKINWDFAELELKGIPADTPKPDYDSLPAPENIDRNSASAFFEWYRNWIADHPAEWQTIEQSRRDYDAARPFVRAARVQPDGTFRVEDVPPGQYEFYVRVFQPNDPENISPLAGISRNSSNTRLSLMNMFHEPVIVVPDFEGTQTDVPADLGDMQTELRE